MAILKKKGVLALGPDGGPVLVNNQERVFQFNEALIAIWDMCDGTVTEEDVCQALSQKTGKPIDHVRGLVSKFILQLKQYDLME
jgi:hypothetical protein